MKFAKEMKAESERHIREGMIEDELELLTILKKDKMTKEETRKSGWRPIRFCIGYVMNLRRC